MSVTTPPRHRIGVHSHLFRGSPQAVADACRHSGLTCVQLTPNFPGLVFQEPGQITPERCRRAAEPLQAAGIAIACLSGYTNLMAPDLDRRHRGILRLHALIRHCRDFGTDRIVTETGSLNPQSPWQPHGPNRSPEAWAELRRIVAEASAVAAGHGVTLLLKAEPAHVLASVEDVVRLRTELDHPCLGFVMDPAALLLETPPAEHGPRLEQAVSLLGPWTPVVHAKDLRWEGGVWSTPRAGLGLLDWGRFFRLLDRHQPGAPVILEHLRAHETDATRAHLEDLMRTGSAPAPPPAS